jgi:hypothetical protein
LRLCVERALDSRDSSVYFVQNSFKNRATMPFSTILLLVLALVIPPTLARADWAISASSAGANIEFGRSTTLAISINNIGDQASPAQTLQSGGFQPFSDAYQLILLSGGCGNWFEAFQGSVPVIRFAIPAIPAGGTHICRYSIAALSEVMTSLNLRFSALGYLNSVVMNIKIGALTDLGASAIKLSSTANGGQFVNRYLITVSNYGARDVQGYGFASCNTAQFGYSVRKNFPGGCNFPVLGASCFSAPFSFSAGPIAAGQQAHCEIETTGVQDPFLGIHRLQEILFNAQGAPLLDNNPSNDTLVLSSPSVIQVSTLSGLGVFALVLGLIFLRWWVGVT